MSFIRNVSKDKLHKYIIVGISAIVSVLIGTVLLLISNGIVKGLDSQNMASRWSDKKDVSQVSCFFSNNATLSEDYIKTFEHELDAALLEAAIVSESTNPGARLWADAYSCTGTLQVKSDKTTMSVDAVGIGGDFFLFHPIKLLSGSYFSGNDLNSDYCLLDQDSAWQLFGSNDVVGMMVYIGGIPHVVSGVLEREQGRMEEAAGLDSTCIYVSCETLENYGTGSGINHYEIVMPNPVSKYAYGYVSERLGADSLNSEIVENTTRFSLKERLVTLTEFGTRSMNGKAIIYPYWENIARGYEDIIVVYTLITLIMYIYAIGVVVVFIFIYWRNKEWTYKDVFRKISDLVNRIYEKIMKGRKEDYEEII